MMFLTTTLSITLLVLANLTLIHSAGVDVTTRSGRQECTVYARGSNKTDVPNILRAFKTCGNGGNVVFPEDQHYWIAERFNPVVRDVRIEWRGQWTFSDNLTYWRANSYVIPFQNHRAGFVLTGDGISIDGHGTGGIHGNGDAWYTAEAGKTVEGRPMPFVFWNTSSVAVQNFFVLQPQLWAINIMNGTDMTFDNIVVNATATKVSGGANWVQNTDGFDTMDARNIQLRNFNYQGGDDCIAIKPRSYNIHLSNVTCHGGNGVAIGSLGQYLEDASVVNVVMDNFLLKRSNQLPMRIGTYIKTWMGVLVNQTSYESAYQPRGAGWGSVRNIVFSNFVYDSVNNAPSITQNNGGASAQAGTSLMDVSNVAFVNFTGTLSGETNRASVSCSNVHPCYNIAFEGMELKGSSGANLSGTCRYADEGGVHGLAGCS